MSRQPSRGAHADAEPGRRKPPAPEVVLDFETCNPYCDLPEVGSTVYAQHWATEILCLCWQNSGTHYRWLPAHGTDTELWHLSHDPLIIFVAHSAGFEKDIWREIMVPVYGFPDIPDDRWHDTQAVCALKAVPLSLEKVLPVLGLGAKDMAGSKLTISLSRFGGRKWTGQYTGKPLPERSPDVMQRVYEYCRKDVDDEFVLHHALGCLPDFERRVWLLDQTINQRGVRLDAAFIRGSQSVVSDARRPLVAEFRELTGGIDPNQTAAVVQWAQDQGVVLPNLQKGTIADLLGDDDEDGRETARGHATGQLDALPSNVRRALAVRALVGSSSVSKLSRMAQCIARDGRVHRLLQYHGTGPGRWAGRLFNPLNFPRGLVRTSGDHKPPDPEAVSAALSLAQIDAVDALGLVVETRPGQWRPANPIEVVASALRHAIVPAPGCMLTVGDFSGIQARTVLALAGQHDKTALMAGGADVYLDMAEDIFSVPKGSLTKSDVEKRQIGKNTVLGCGFQMGWQKFHAKYCADKPEEFASQVIDAYREKWAPMVPRLWRALEDAALRTVYDRTPHEAYGIEYRIEGRWLTARLLDGKKIWYFNPQRATQAPPWAPDEHKDTWTYQATKMGRLVTIYAYGGLLTENVVMGLERQLLVRAMFRCEAENFPVIFNSYDEIVSEPELAYAKWEHLKQIMEDRPQWAKEIRLPIAAEGWVGSRYRKG